MQQASGDPLIGRLLEGRYRILDRIARGGMSTVYRGVDLRLDRPVAIKVMAPNLAADAKFVDRFSREARAAARLTHVNAVAVFDQGIDTAQPQRVVFLVMELVEGRTLRDLIRERQGRFTPAEAVSIMEPVLSALSAAHRAGLVHRDVKPENILLSNAGLVKVADFGLARAADSDLASTRTGLVMGTVAYCAPEQITHGRTDQRSDVYSAGVVLFELLTGRPPFQGESPMNVAYQHVHHRVPAPSSRRTGIPTEIDETVVAATDSDPTARPPDAAAFLAELADLRSALSLPVIPVPLPARRRAQVGVAAAPSVRRPIPAATTAMPRASRTANDTLYDLSHPSPVTPLPPFVAAPQPSGPTPLDPRRRRRRRVIIGLILVVLIGAAAVLAGFWGVHKLRDWSDAHNLHVPKVAGYSVDRARHTLQTVGYQVDPHLSTEFSDTVDKDAVIGTDPSSGRRLSKGSVVRLIVSLGPDLLPVPQVHNQTLGEATTDLQGHGLVVSKVLTRPSINVAKGKVITTRPHAGEQVHKGAGVVVLQSSGLPTFAVPGIAVGTSFHDARHAIEGVQGADFKVHRVRDYNNDVPAGGVISVDPAGGDQPYGTTFTVHVSRGPEYVTIPDYPPGTTLSEFEQQLDQLGLHYTTQQPYPGGDGTLVLATDPPAGAQAHPGDTVTVIVY